MPSSCQKPVRPPEGLGVLREARAETAVPQSAGTAIGAVDVLDVALPQVFDSIKSQVAVARAYSVPLIAYEGGQHLAGYGGVENDTAIVEQLIERLAFEW